MGNTLVITIPVLAQEALIALYKALGMSGRSIGIRPQSPQKAAS